MKKTLFLLLTSLIVSSAGSLLQARVGESQSSLEGRLLRDQGKKYFREGVEHRLRRNPFTEALSYTQEMSGNFNLMVYWKRAGRAEGRTDLTSRESPPGWDFYVLYVNGSSAGEYYERHGARINQFEQNSILAVNKGSSFWKELSNEEKRQQNDSFWGFDYELDDGSLRAKKQGNGILIFNSQMDKQLRAVKDVADEERRKLNEQEAPSSTEGF